MGARHIWEGGLVGLGACLASGPAAGSVTQRKLLFMLRMVKGGAGLENEKERGQSRGGRKKRK